MPNGLFLNPAVSVLLPVGLGTAVGFSATSKIFLCGMMENLCD